MAHPYTFPTLFDELPQLSMKNLKGMGFLKEYRTGVLTWSSNGHQTARVAITASPTSQPPYIELDYTAAGKPVNYRIELTTIPSNLGRGTIWRFICPVTGKQTKILYLIGSYFLHREACPGGMYQKQTYSKKRRRFVRSMDAIFKADEIPERYFRPYYKGKPTRTLKRLLKNKKQVEGLDIEELFRH